MMVYTALMNVFAVPNVLCHPLTGDYKCCALMYIIEVSFFLRWRLLAAAAAAFAFIFVILQRRETCLAYTDGSPHVTAATIVMINPL